MRVYDIGPELLHQAKETPKRDKIGGKRDSALHFRDIVDVSLLFHQVGHVPLIFSTASRYEEHLVSIPLQLVIEAQDVQRGTASPEACEHLHDANRPARRSERSQAIA